MGLAELYDAVSKLRKVSELIDTILPEDHNNVVDALNALYDVLTDYVSSLKTLCTELEVNFPMELEDKVNELGKKVGEIRYVKYGDFVLADDHNKIVDALKTAKNVCSAINDLITELEAKTEAMKNMIYVHKRIDEVGGKPQAEPRKIYSRFSNTLIGGRIISVWIQTL